MLVLFLVPLLLPAAAGADCPHKIHLGFETLPVTRVTSSTAVFSGRCCETIRIKLSQPNPYDWPWAFEYATRHGVYTSKIPADIVSETAEYGIDGDYLWLRM